MKNGMAPLSRLRNTIRTWTEIINVHCTLEGKEVHTMVHEGGGVSTVDPEEEDL